MNKGLYPGATGTFISNEVPAVQNNATITVLHGLRSVPRVYSCRLVCKLTDAGYAPGSEADVIGSRNTGAGGNNHCSLVVDGSAISLVLEGSNNWQLVNPSTNNFTPLTISKWAFKFYCSV